MQHGTAANLLIWLVELRSGREWTFSRDTTESLKSAEIREIAKNRQFSPKKPIFAKKTRNREIGDPRVILQTTQPQIFSRGFSWKSFHDHARISTTMHEFPRPRRGLEIQSFRDSPTLLSDQVLMLSQTNLLVAMQATHLRSFLFFAK